MHRQIKYSKFSIFNAHAIRLGLQLVDTNMIEIIFIKLVSFYINKLIGFRVTQY